MSETKTILEECTIDLRPLIDVCKDMLKEDARLFHPTCTLQGVVAGFDLGQKVFRSALQYYLDSQGFIEICKIPEKNGLVVTLPWYMADMFTKEDWDSSSDLMKECAMNMNFVTDLLEKELVKAAAKKVPDVAIEKVANIHFAEFDGMTLQLKAHLKKLGFEDTYVPSNQVINVRLPIRLE